MTNELLKQIEHAPAYRDTGRFDQLIRQIEVEMKPRGNRGKEQFAPDQEKGHFLKLASRTRRLTRLCEQVEAINGSEHLDELPQDDEIWATMREMKLSAAGDGEITIDMLRDAEQLVYIAWSPMAR